MVIRCGRLITTASGRVDRGRIHAVALDRGFGSWTHWPTAVSRPTRGCRLRGSSSGQSRTVALRCRRPTTRRPASTSFMPQHPPAPAAAGMMPPAISRCALCAKSKCNQCQYRVATRPGFPGMSRICTMLFRVPARLAQNAKCPGFQGAVKITTIVN